MTEEIAKHSKFLSKICKANQIERTKLLKKATESELQVLCEIILNVYNKNVNVSKPTISKLTPFKKVIKLLLNKKLSSKKRRVIFCQQGGLLPLLVPAITALLSSLIL